MQLLLFSPQKVTTHENGLLEVLLASYQSLRQELITISRTTEILLAVLVAGWVGVFTVSKDHQEVFLMASFGNLVMMTYWLAVFTQMVYAASYCGVLEARINELVRHKALLWESELTSHLLANPFPLLPHTEKRHWNPYPILLAISVVAIFAFHGYFAVRGLESIESPVIFMLYALLMFGWPVVLTLLYPFRIVFFLSLIRHSAKAMSDEDMAAHSHRVSD